MYDLFFSFFFPQSFHRRSQERRRLEEMRKRWELIPYSFRVDWY